MARVTGLGGVFLKATDPQALARWYAEHLGLAPAPDGSVVIGWRELDRPEQVGGTVWSLFERDSSYFAPSDAQAMVNYRVDDLGALLAQLEAAGVTLAGEPEAYPYGRFGWILDPEGNKIELWEPPAEGSFQPSVPPPTADGARFLAARPSLGVADVTAALPFWRDALGLAVVATLGAPPTFALLRRDAAEVALVADEAPAVAAHASVYLTVSDVDVVYRRCVAAGSPIIEAPTARPWGVTDFVATDPDGHRVAVGQATAPAPEG